MIQNKKQTKTRVILRVLDHFSFSYLKRRFRAGSLFSRVLREIFEKKIIRPLVGIQLVAGIVMIGPLSLVEEHPEGSAYPGALLADGVIQASVEPVITTNSNQMQNPTAGFKGVSTRFQAGHPGYDLRATLGSDVYPIDEGVVKQIAHSTYGYGRRVIVTHEDGFESLYAHMGLITVEEGEVVTRETKLGEVGMTGWTTGPHIHLEIHENGVPVNPYYYLDLDDIPNQQ